MYIVVDVGGTNTRVASSMDGKTIADKKRFRTPKAFQEGVAQITEAVEELSSDEKIRGVAIGVPGVVNRSAGKTLMVHNLTSWNDREIIKTFGERLKTPVVFANDAELAALGEAVFGAGKNHRIVAYLTVSTGVGGALVVDKKLIPHTYNAEPSVMMIELDGKIHPGSKQVGAWESYASGTAFKERFGMEAKDCDDPGIWEIHAQYVGQGVLNVILLWSPEILVIGGGLSRTGDLLFDPLRKFVKENLKMFPPPPIVPAKLGDDAGLFGGLALIHRKRKED